MRPQEALKYKLDAPVSACWEGVYIDDHLITQRLPLSCMKCVRHVNECACCARRPGPWRDQEIVESFVRVYEDRKLVRNLEKAFRYPSKFESWGTAVDGRKGTVQTDDKKLRQLVRLGFALLAGGSASSPSLHCSICFGGCAY